MLTVTLLTIIAVLIVGLVAILFIWNNAYVRLARYDRIDDLETYAEECQQKAESAKQEAAAIASGLATAKQRLKQYMEVAGVVRNAAEAKQRADYLQRELIRIKGEVEAIEEVGNLQSFGFYNRRFPGDTPEELKRKLEDCQQALKAMIKAKSACACESPWTVNGDAKEGERMTKEYIRLMLRAFNGEADATISRVRHNNAEAMAERLQQAWYSINQAGGPHKTSISRSYFELKQRELHLTHEYELARQEQKELEREHRDRIREEQKVEKEIAKALKDSEREEKIRLKALEEARRQLSEEHGRHNEKLAQLVWRLETELQEAIDRKAKAIARAQLTRSGHVYILSNEGAFGKNVFKIGMTRRLEPLERVRELGGASVPFPFDVHALIYTEDAPALENALHKWFDERRVNLVNLRREFFRVSLDEIREAVAEHYGLVTFVLEADALQYRETLAKLAETEAQEAVA
jgi:hypothetical protein